jgi:hypothetical protein
MFNDDITKQIAQAAAEVFNKSTMGDSVLPQNMIDSANSIQDSVKNAESMEEKNQLIKDAMLTTAKENNISLTPSAGAEFEKRAKGGS